MTWLIIALTVHRVVTTNECNFTLTKEYVKQLDKYVHVVESNHPYENNQSCRKTLTASVNGEKGHFRFVKFDVEGENPMDDYNRENGRKQCEFDFVRITSKNTTGYVIKNTYVSYVQVEIEPFLVFNMKWFRCT